MVVHQFGRATPQSHWTGVWSSITQLYRPDRVDQTFKNEWGKGATPEARSCASQVVHKLLPKAPRLILGYLQNS